MKIRYKKDYQFLEGHVVDPETGDCIVLPAAVVFQAHRLDLMAQQYDYLSGQPAYQPGPSLSGFRRKSIRDHSRPYIEDPETPVTDARVAEAMLFMQEADEIHRVKDVNDAINEFGDLFDFLCSDHWFEPCAGGATFIDAPTLGNILELTPEEARGILEEIASSPIVLE